MIVFASTGLSSALVSLSFSHCSLLMSRGTNISFRNSSLQSSTLSVFIYSYTLSTFRIRTIYILQSNIRGFNKMSATILRFIPNIIKSKYIYVAEFEYRTK